MTQRLETESKWVHEKQAGEYVKAPSMDTIITVHYSGGVSYKMVDWVEIVQKNPVPNPLWDDMFRFSEEPDVVGTKPKLRKLRYDGKMETVETLYSTTHAVEQSIGLIVHTIQKYHEERESTGVLSGNVVGFWAEARKYSPYIEALTEQENQLRSNHILAEFLKPDEPIAEENPKRTLKDTVIVDVKRRRLYEESNRLNR